FSHHTEYTQIYTLSLHDALPIFCESVDRSIPQPAAKADRLSPLRAMTSRSRARKRSTVAQRSIPPSCRFHHDCCESAPHERLSRSEEHTSELQSRENLVCRLLLE